MYCNPTILNEYIEKDKSTINNKSGLSFTSDSNNLYPILMLDTDFMESVRMAEIKLLAMYTLLSFLVIVVIFILFKFCCTIFEKYSNRKFIVKVKEYLYSNGKWCCFNSVIILIILYLLNSYSNYNFVINYENTLTDSQSIIYYNFNENYLSERFAMYTNVNGNSGDNKISGFGDIIQIQLVPNNSVNTTAYIRNIDIYRDNICIRSFSAKDLTDKYIDKNRSNVDNNDSEFVSVTSTEEIINPVILFNNNFYNEINSFSVLNTMRDVFNVVILFAFINAVLWVYCYGIKNSNTLKEKIKVRYVKPFMALAICSVAIIGYSINIGEFILITSVFVLLIYALLKGVFGYGTCKGRVYSVIGLCMCAFVLLGIKTSFVNGEAVYYADYLWNSCLLVLLSIIYLHIYDTFKNKDKCNTKNLYVNDIAGIIIKIAIAVFVYEYIKAGFIHNSTGIMYIVERMLGAVSQLNIMWLFFAFLFIYFLVGKNLSNTVAAVIYAVILLGNIIKLTYHDTFLTPSDFMQIKDMISIAPDVIGKLGFYGIICGICVAVILIIVNIKKIKVFLRPKCSISSAIIFFVLIVGFTNQALSNEFNGINLYDKPYADVQTCENTNGIAFFNIFNIKHIPDMNMDKPDNYTEEVVKADIERFKNFENDDENIKPNVICILAESFVDMNEIDEINCSDDITPMVHSMNKSDLISPRYGGYTAAIEYEVLTAMSLAFYPPGTIPYTAYYNNSKKIIPSVVTEFADNGYKTIAIHPNVGNFYNRDKAYSKMGFDEYIDISKFDNPEVTMNSFVKNTEISKKIIDNINNTEEPVFQFGITLEEHFTNEQRYDSTEIKITSDKLEKSLINEMEQQAQSYRYTDEMIAELKAYMDSSEEPIILYVFGDHLPPLNAFERLDYIKEDYNKYRTILLGYSNYKDINLPEKMTPNYLAPQMLIDAGIKHSNYYDYIYSLRKETPVFHSNYIDKNDERFNLYYMIQYDIMFGNQWFYNLSNNRYFEREEEEK